MCSVLIDQCDKLGVCATLWEETLSAGHQCVPGWGAQDSEGLALEQVMLPSLLASREKPSLKRQRPVEERWVAGMGSFVHSLKTLPSFKMRGMRISKKQRWLRVGAPQEPRRDGSEKHPQQSEKFLSTKRYCIISTPHRQKHKFQLPTFIYNWTKSRRMKPVPSATQAALAAGRMKYSNYSGLPHMVTGAQTSTCNQERERGQGKKVPWVFGFLPFIVAVRARVKQKRLISCRGHRKYIQTH